MRKNTIAESMLRLLVAIIYIVAISVLVTLVLPNPNHPTTVLILLIGIPVSGHALLKDHLSEMGYSIMTVSFVTIVLVITTALLDVLGSTVLDTSQEIISSATTGTLMGTFVLSYYILIRYDTISNKYL
jgi:uncharacterized protein YqgC (DUF456 family)